jgi:hypothetical protein
VSSHGAIVATRPLLAAAWWFVDLIRRRPWLVLAAGVVALGVIGVLTPAYADDGPAPRGFDDLLAGPDLTQNGALSPTLYEAYPLGSYYFDTNRLNQTSDFIHITLNGLASVLMFLTAAVVRGAIVVVWIMFDDGTSEQLTASLSPSIGLVASALMPWMLPTALALGGVIAYARSRDGGGGGLSQIAWLFAGGTLAISFAVTPHLWVNTLTDAREVTAGTVMSAAATSVTTTSTPFAFPAATYDETNPMNRTLRNTADSIWRSYVVTPWCVAEFGSNELCTRYGKGLLDQGDPDSRSAWIQSSQPDHPGEYNSGGPAYRWIAGKNSYERLGMAFVALLVGVIFAALVIVVAFGSQIALYTALIALFVGAFFVMLWCIPGRPREWGNRWLEAVIGLLIQSVLNALVLTATLTLTSRAFYLSGGFGWAVAAALSIGVTVAAFTMRRTLATILSMTMPGMGLTTMLGRVALQGGSKAVGWAGGAVRATVRRSGGRGAAGTAGAAPASTSTRASVKDRDEPLSGRRGRMVSAGTRGREVPHRQPRRRGLAGARPTEQQPSLWPGVGRPQLRENPPVRREPVTVRRAARASVLKPVRPQMAPPKPVSVWPRRPQARPARPSPRRTD